MTVYVRDLLTEISFVCVTMFACTGSSFRPSISREHSSQDRTEKDTTDDIDMECWRSVT